MRMAEWIETVTALAYEATSRSLVYAVCHNGYCGHGDAVCLHASGRSGSSGKTDYHQS